MNMKLKTITRRKFLKNSSQIIAGLSTIPLIPRIVTTKTRKGKKPNIIFISADQLRAQALGCMGNKQVKTPNFDRLASEGALFTHSISTFPVCTPARAMWLTGKYPTSTGVISNDMQLSPKEVTSAEVLKDQDYQTGYIGKWHLDGPERKSFTPAGPRRQGFDFWAAANICHKYFNAFYYTDSPEKIHINGYQPDHETDLALQFLENHRKHKFFLNLHWSPPHDPYIAPKAYMEMYDSEKIKLRDNVLHCVPKEIFPSVQKQIAAYYAAITNLDWNMGRIMKALDDLNLSENTIVIFTSDHGDMLFSLALLFKQWPYDESIRVPLIIRYPRRIKAGLKTDSLISTVDNMPTILSLAGVKIPDRVQGLDFSNKILGENGPDPESTLIMCVQPCARYNDRVGMLPWRGLRTKRYTFARFRHQDWCLFDNEKDVFQRRSLLTKDYDKPDVKALRNKLNTHLESRLKAIGDTFDSNVFPRVRWY
jgi:arylsulfatase A-like enzyme